MAPTGAGSRRPPRETLPRVKVIDFAELPARCDTRLAGLLLLVPELVALDLPGVVAAAGYPDTRVIPVVSSVLSLLTRQLVGVRRVSHVDDLAADPAAGLFAGLAALPKATALTIYSYRLTHERQGRFLAALDRAMLDGGPAEGGDSPAPVCASLRRRLGTGYTAATPDTLQRRFLSTGGTIHTHGDTITVRLDRRTYSPVLRSVDIPDTTVPWWGDRTLHFDYA